MWVGALIRCWLCDGGCSSYRAYCPAVKQESCCKHENKPICWALSLVLVAQFFHGRMIFVVQPFSARKHENKP